MENEAKTMNTKELTEVVCRLLDREETQDRKERRRARRRLRRRRKEMEMSVSQLTSSIEVIKWCIVGITFVMFLSLVILIAVVLEIQSEAERIKFEVQRIQREAEGLREKIRHPLESLGSTMGRRVEGNLRDYLGIEEEVEK
jgi:hypothetical protein